MYAKMSSSYLVGVPRRSCKSFPSSSVFNQDVLVVLKQNLPVCKHFANVQGFFSLFSVIQSCPRFLLLFVGFLYVCECVRVYSKETAELCAA